MANEFTFKFANLKTILTCGSYSFAKLANIRGECSNMGKEIRTRTRAKAGTREGEGVGG